MISKGFRTKRMITKGFWTNRLISKVIRTNRLIRKGIRTNWFISKIIMTNQMISKGFRTNRMVWKVIRTNRLILFPPFGGLLPFRWSQMTVTTIAIKKSDRVNFFRVDDFLAALCPPVHTYMQVSF
jgi:hypothetical protein